MTNETKYELNAADLFETINDLRVSTKVNKQEIRYDFSQIHPSWIVALLRKGVQRYANDLYSGEEGNVKYDLCRKLADDAMSGNPCPEKVIKQPSMADDVSRAVSMAKADLLPLFKQLTGKGKIADMLDDETVSAYFTKDGVWLNEKVLAYIEKQKESGERDYLQEAQEQIERAKSDKTDLRAALGL